jgi:glycosyltransferase involved in cell wall biosynthesis
MTKILFYAPLKAPTHETPSGDRFMARQFMKLFREMGYEIDLISDFRSWSKDGCDQEDLKKRACIIRDELILKYNALPYDERPKFCFTYHLYHKAPDWIGSALSKALNVPYIVAEASIAPTQESGPWALGYKDSVAQIKQAAVILNLGMKDFGALSQVISEKKIHHFLPFLEYLEPVFTKQFLAEKYGLSQGKKWLLTVAMMRAGSKEASYKALAESLRSLKSDDWQLIVIGDGEKSDEIKAKYARFKNNISFLGLQDEDTIRAFYTASDIYLWPAIDEAYGITILEAQSQGLPVIAGDYGSVSSIVKDKETGFVVPRLDTEVFFEKIEALLHDKQIRDNLSKNAEQSFLENFTFDAARTRMTSILEGLAINV